MVATVDAAATAGGAWLITKGISGSAYDDNYYTIYDPKKEVPFKTVPFLRRFARSWRRRGRRFKQDRSSYTITVRTTTGEEEEEVVVLVWRGQAAAMHLI